MEARCYWCGKPLGYQASNEPDHCGDKECAKEVNSSIEFSERRCRADEEYYARYGYCYYGEEEDFYEEEIGYCY